MTAHTNQVGCCECETVSARYDNLRQGSYALFVAVVLAYAIWAVRDVWVKELTSPTSMGLG
jgi:hypothetical protein